jgi:hypothetical protein
LNLSNSNKSNPHLISIIPDAPLRGIGILLLSNPVVLAETITTSERQISHFYKSRCHPAGKRIKYDSEKSKITNPAVTQ